MMERYISGYDGEGTLVGMMGGILVGMMERYIGRYDGEVH